jgi:hypothetical protein
VLDRLELVESPDPRRVGNQPSLRIRSAAAKRSVASEEMAAANPPSPAPISVTTNSSGSSQARHAASNARAQSAPNAGVNSGDVTKWPAKPVRGMPRA